MAADWNPCEIDQGQILRAWLPVSDCGEWIILVFSRMRLREN
jgi:hypothetical protein